MTIVDKLLVAIGIVWVAAATALAFMSHAGRVSAVDLLFIFRLLSFAPMTFAVLAAISALVAIVSVFVGARRRAWVGVTGAVAWGLSGAAYLEFGVWNRDLRHMNSPLPFSAYGVFHTEPLLVLLVGLTGALLGLAAMRLHAPRAA